MISIHPAWQLTPYGEARGFRLDMLGEIPHFLDEVFDPRPAREQIGEAYAHGGGWSPVRATFNVDLRDGLPVILFPGDPPLFPLAETALGNERLFYFLHDFVCILQPDGQTEVARVD